MKKNYSDTISNKENRQLTAKGNKFIWDCIKIVANYKGVCIYSQEIKEQKDKLKEIITFLLIDKELSIADVKQIIAMRKNNNELELICK